jgi:MFS family permease
MPDQPGPEVEDIDEDAARRSIRRRMIFVGVAGLAMLSAGVLFGALYRPVGVHHDASAWLFVLPLAVVAISLGLSVPWLRRLSRRPAYRRVMQYDQKRLRRVGKDLRRGRALSAEDMPVAAALVGLQRSRSNGLLILWALLFVSNLVQGGVSHGFLRWSSLGVAVCFGAAVWFTLREQRQMIRNYERQSTLTA